jgi:hypothetical protein
MYPQKLPPLSSPAPNLERTLESAYNKFSGQSLDQRSFYHQQRQLNMRATSLPAMLFLILLALMLLPLSMAAAVLPGFSINPANPRSLLTKRHDWAFICGTEDAQGNEAYDIPLSRKPASLPLPYMPLLKNVRCLHRSSLQIFVRQER